MQNHLIYEKLKSLATKYGNLLAKQEGVLGVVISGSVARGDVWEGSDVDLHVLWDSERTSTIGGFEEGILINVHDVPIGYMEYITNDLNGFCRSELPDQLYKCQIIYDPKGLWAKYKNIIDSKRFHPEIIANMVRFKVTEADRSLLKASKAVELKDYASAVFYAQQSAVWAAFAMVIKCGGLIKSANRFPESLKAIVSKKGLDEFYQLFCLVHGLTGKFDAVKKVVLACETLPKTFINELYRVGIPIESLRGLLEDFVIEIACFSETVSEEMIIESLMDETPIRCGYFDGKLIWMRTNRWITFPLWASWFKTACNEGAIDPESPTIAEDMRNFHHASDAFYKLFLDFICLQTPSIENAQKRFELVKQMIKLVN